MKNKNKLIFPSLFLMPIMACVLFVDLAGTFNYGDISFAIVFALYIIFIAIQHAKSKTTFVIAFLFLIWMGLSYLPTGAGQVTERFGEWFYLFFLFGIVQYTYEVLRRKQS